MLKGSNLVKSYGDQKIIDQASLELAPGEISVIIGPSGSGKTSLIRMLSLLEKPDSGQIAVDDYNYSFPLSKQDKFVPPWPKVTVVFQQLFLWPHLTLLQNITLPLAVGKQSVADEKVDEMISLFEMEKFIYRYPNEASLGQKQRAALVRALLLEPKYLLLDEITSSLDVEQIAIILSHLKDLAKRGIGILTVTHLLHFAQEAADRIIFMDGGKIIESGGKEVLSSPKHDRVQKFLSVIESAS
ncbi:MAG: ATP-binding cassette domain-containing protein [Candidatus Obscuribacterales bacterium]|nr:ATP-binding cassette domain-containing protein [Candidatus Obscuribacterales bacterium]